VVRVRICGRLTCQHLSCGDVDHGRVTVPELDIDPDKVKVAQGMHITIVTTAKTNDEGRELLRQFGMPFITG